LALAAKCACQLVCLHEQLPPTERTKVRRKPDRGSSTANSSIRILDEAFVCHVGFIADGMPVRKSYKLRARWRQLFLHGSVAKPLDENARQRSNLLFLIRF